MRYFILFFTACSLFAAFDPEEPIDVVIPSIEKDLPTLELAIEGISLNCKNVRRIVVVSKNKLTENAEWVDEALFPFSKWQVACELTRNTKVSAKDYVKKWNVNWYYQQLLKLYAPLVIPGLSDNVLVLDSDTIFLNPVSFVNERGGGLYATREYIHKEFVQHLKRFYPPFKEPHEKRSGVVHHMLFQREPLAKLFRFIEGYHKAPPWKVFCRLVAEKDLFGAGASEYEIYFNFVFSNYPEVEIRELKWLELSSWKEIEPLREGGIDYITCHTWLRKKKKK